MKNSYKFIFFISFLFLLLIAFSHLINLYEKRTKIKSFLVGFFNPDSKYTPKEDDLYWANEIMKGGYILHFRHAERDKWIDVQMYDALESDIHLNGNNESRYAENDYFANAVCLNERGKIQAMAMGESLKHIGLPIGNVVSSVSCRARQTAELAFGGYKKMLRILVHRGPYYENEKERVKQLKELYQNLIIEDGTNTVVSSHNSTISCKMFINNNCPTQLNFEQMISLEEGGFFIISRTNEGLILEHEFHNFNDFNKFFYKR